MAIETPTLKEFVWEYAKSHNYMSRVIISGKYIDTFGIKRKRDEDRKAHQRAIGRKIGSIFTIMKNLGIVNKHSQRTVHVNREVFNTFTLQDILNNVHKDKKP